MKKNIEVQEDLRMYNARKEKKSSLLVFAAILFLISSVALTGYTIYDSYVSEQSLLNQQSVPILPEPTYNASLNYTIKAFWTDEVPVIDGVVNETAWNGVGTYTVIENESHIITIYASMDEDNLYIGVIAENDTDAENNDYCKVFFDVGHNETSAPDTNDVMVTKTYDGEDALSYWIGNGTDWIEFVPPPGCNCTSNASTTNSKVSWEFQIPIEYMNLYGRFNSTDDWVGFGVQVMDWNEETPQYTMFPDDYYVGESEPDNYLEPNTWGDLYDGNSTDMTASYSTNTPIIDGSLTLGEWSDADVYTVDLTKDLKIYTMNDGTYVYIAVESLDETTDDNNDFCQIYFDCDHDATVNPDANDKMIEIDGGGTVNYFEGSVATWTSVSTPFGWAAGEGTTSGHESYEFRVVISNLNETGDFWQDYDEIGFGVHICNDESGTFSDFMVWWPDNYDGSAPWNTYEDEPNTWGDLILLNADVDPPEITDVNDVPDPQEYNGYVNITVDLIDNRNVNTAWVNITGVGNYSMSPGTGNEWYLNQTYTSVGQNNYTIRTDDTSNNWNSSIEYSFNITDEVMISFISQTPTNVRWNSSGAFEVVFNVSTHSTPIDTDTILFANTAYRPGVSYNFTFHFPPNQNQPYGPRAHDRNEYRWFEIFNVSGSGEIGDIGEWGVYDNTTPNINIISSGTNWTLCNFTTELVNDMYASANYIDQESLEDEDKTGQTYNTYGTNAVKTNFNLSSSERLSLGFNNTVIFVHFYAEPVNNPGSLNVYIANSSYTTGDPATSNNCTLIGQVTQGQSYHHQRSNSSYYEINLTVNSTGYLNSMLLTTNFSVIFDGGVDVSNYWRIYYADDNDTYPSYYYDFNQSSTTRICTDYTDWSATNGSIDCRVLGFKKDNQTVIRYKIHANDTSGNSNWSVIINDIIDEANIAPTLPIIIKPDGVAPTDEYYEHEVINITYIWHGDTNGDNCWLNLTCHNSSGNIVAWIQNRSITLPEYFGVDTFYYDWNTTGTTPGNNYYINVTITDMPYGVSVYDEQNGTFNLLIDTPPDINNVSDQLDPQEYGGYVNITCNVTDNLGVDTVWTNITGIGNYSMNQSTGNVWYYNNTYSILGLFNYIVWANDTYDGWNSSATYNFTIHDTTDPIVTNVTITPVLQEVRFNVNVTVNVTDNVEVYGVWLNITYPNSTYQNVSMTDIGSDIWFYNQTYGVYGDFSITVWANDTSDNWDGATGEFEIFIEPLDLLLLVLINIIALAIVLFIFLLIFKLLKDVLIEGADKKSRKRGK